MTCSPSHYIDPNTDQFVFFLLVSLLTFWSLPTTAQLAIVSTTAAEGTDVVLSLRNKSPNVRGYIWYKGEGADPDRYILAIVLEEKVMGIGPEFSGREKIDSDGSLLIKKVTLKHSGHYTVVVYLQNDLKEIGFGRLLVYGEWFLSDLWVSEGGQQILLHTQDSGLCLHPPLHHVPGEVWHLTGHIQWRQTFQDFPSLPRFHP